MSIQSFHLFIFLIFGVNRHIVALSVSCMGEGVILIWVILSIQIVDKALEEPKYSSLYAQLCLRLAEDAPNFDGPAPEIQPSQKQSTVSTPVLWIFYYLVQLLCRFFLKFWLFFFFLFPSLPRPSEDFWYPSFKMNLKTAPKMLKVSRPALFLQCFGNTSVDDVADPTLCSCVSLRQTGQPSHLWGGGAASHCQDQDARQH